MKNFIKLIVKPFVGNLFKNAGKGVPLVDSVRKAVVAWKEAKFDWKKLSWMVVQFFAAMGFVWIVLYTCKTWGMNTGELLELVEQILKLGL